MMNLDFSPLIKDGNIDSFILQELLKTMQDYLNKQKDFSNFKFFKITETGAVVNKTVKHLLNYLPKDVIMLSTNPSTSTITFQPESYTSSDLVYSTSGACTVRFLIGTFKESA